MKFPVLISYYNQGHKVALAESVADFPTGLSFRIVLQDANILQLEAIRSYIGSTYAHEQDDDIPF